MRAGRWSGGGGGRGELRLHAPPIHLCADETKRDPYLVVSAQKEAESWLMAPAVLVYLRAALLAAFTQSPSNLTPSLPQPVKFPR